jgi:hypothetical protein
MSRKAYRICTLYTYNLHPIYIQFAPYIHKICTLYTYKLHPIYIQFAPYIRTICTLHTYNLHPMYIQFAPYIQYILFKTFAKQSAENAVLTPRVQLLLWISA